MTRKRRSKRASGEPKSKRGERLRAGRGYVLVKNERVFTASILKVFYANGSRFAILRVK